MHTIKLNVFLAFAALLFLPVICTATPNATYYLGNTITTSTTFADTLDGNYVRSYAFIAPTNAGVVDYLGFYSENSYPTARARVVIYADSGTNTPTTIIAKVSQFVLAGINSGMNFWPNATTPHVQLTPGKKYHLTILSNATISVRSEANIPADYMRGKIANIYNDGFPDPMSAFTDFSNSQILIFACDDFQPTPTATPTVTATPTPTLSATGRKNINFGKSWGWGWFYK